MAQTVLFLKTIFLLIVRQSPKLGCTGVSFRWQVGCDIPVNPLELFFFANLDPLLVSWVLESPALDELKGINDSDQRLHVVRDNSDIHCATRLLGGNEVLGHHAELERAWDNCGTVAILGRGRLPLGLPVLA